MSFNILLGVACMEITPDPSINNATELITKNKISGVFPVRFLERIGENYPYPTITKIRVYIVDGRTIDIELQDVSNQATWNDGTLSAQKQAISDINTWLINEIPPPLPVIIGALVENDFSVSNWGGDTGDCVFAVDGITCNFTGSGVTFTKQIYYNNWISNLENFKLEAVIKLLDISNNYGGSLSIIPYTGATPPNYSAVPLTGSVVPGRVDLWTLDSLVGSATSNFPQSNNDRISVTLEKQLGDLIVTVKNLDQPDVDHIFTKTLVFTYPFDFALLPQVFKIGFSSLNDSSFKVLSYKYSSTDYKNIDALFLHDSKCFYFADTYNNSFFRLLKSANPSKTMQSSGAANETLKDCIAKLPELLLLNAKQYFIYDLGRNDYLSGSITIQSDFQTIKDTLEVNGNKCIYINVTTEKATSPGIGPVGVAAVNAAAALVFDTCIDTSSVLLTDLAPDQIHLGMAIEQHMADLIQPYILP